jgi:hypothetical protein
MKQISFATLAETGKKRKTKRERFLEKMEQVVPWSRLVALIEPHYPKAGKGRRPRGLETMRSKQIRSLEPDAKHLIFVENQVACAKSTGRSNSPNVSTFASRGGKFGAL